MFVVEVKDVFKFFSIAFLRSKGFRVSIEIPQKNKNPKVKSFIKSILTEEIKEKLKQIFEPDLQIYKYALDKFAMSNN